MLIPVKRLQWVVQVDVPEGMKGADHTPPSLSAQPNLNICISTCDRENSYIHAMLGTMLADGLPYEARINLVVSGSCGKYLDSYRHLRRFSINAWDDESWLSVSKLPKKFRASYNYIKCLSLHGKPNCLAFEDDLVFQNNWWRKFLRCVGDIERDGHDRYVLSLFTPWRLKSEKNYAKVARVNWAGTQAMYYPESVLRPMRDYLQSLTNQVCGQREPSDPPYLHAYDMVIKEWCILEEVPIFTCTESLVQHVGKVTAGGTGENIMRSDSFYRSDHGD